MCLRSRGICRRIYYLRWTGVTGLRQIKVVIMPHPKYITKGGKGDAAIYPSVCLSCFLILFCSPDGNMRALPFQTHSIVGSTVFHARTKCYQRGDMSFRHTIPCYRPRHRVSTGGIVLSPPSVLPSVRNSFPLYLTSDLDLLHVCIYVRRLVGWVSRTLSSKRSRWDLDHPLNQGRI